MGNKTRIIFRCSACGQEALQWSGRCSSCGEWGTIEGQASSRRGPGARHPDRGSAGPVLSLGPETEERRIQTGFPGVDRVLGGGLVPGSVVLLAGAPGIGKSTLLLQLASRLTEAGHPCLLASAEEARSQIAARARRLCLDGDRLAFTPGRDVSEVVATAVAQGPAVLIVDSIHTIRDERSNSLSGGVAQVRACADALVAVAKEHGITVLLIGHVTKDGDLAGPRTLEHAVDTVLSFEGDPGSGRRILSGGKNRFGVEGEMAWFEMTSGGLVEVAVAPRVGGGEPEPGCATALPLAGRRSFAIDVQALVVPTEGPPRRHVSGLDARRFQILVAVTDRAARAGLGRAEVYGSAAGGVRLEDPGVDLAVVAALASAGAGRPVRPGVAFVGEVSLTVRSARPPAWTRGLRRPPWQVWRWWWGPRAHRRRLAEPVPVRVHHSGTRDMSGRR